jgi:putative hydrolase of the HAD superfamily
MSCDTGHLKPEREAFTQAETLLGARSEQLVHVGDSLGADVQGALDAGWNAIHIDRTSDATVVMPSPSMTLTALARLLDLFPRYPARRSGPTEVVA